MSDYEDADFDNDYAGGAGGDTYGGDSDNEYGGGFGGRGRGDDGSDDEGVRGGRGRRAGDYGDGDDDSPKKGGKKDDIFEESMHDDEQFVPPSFSEMQQVSVRGKLLNPRNRADAILIEIYNVLKDTFNVDDQETLNSFLEQLENLPNMIYYNPKYLASATYYMRINKVLKKKTLGDFAEKHDLNCAPLVRYSTIVSTATTTE